MLDKTAVLGKILKILVGQKRGGKRLLCLTVVTLLHLAAFRCSSAATILIVHTDFNLGAFYNRHSILLSFLSSSHFLRWCPCREVQRYSRFTVSLLFLTLS